MVSTRSKTGSLPTQKPVEAQTAPNGETGQLSEEKTQVIAPRSAKRRKISDNKGEKSVTVEESKDEENSNPSSQLTKQKDAFPDLGDGDDDAPEEATTSAQADQVGRASVKVAQIAAERERVKKKQRREHDERMREQAQSSKSSKPQKSKGAEGLATKDQEEKASENVTGFQRSKPPLPTYLPTEVLEAHDEAPTTATNGMLMAASTEEHVSQSLAQRQLLHLQQKHKPVKDIVKGNTRYRILDEQSSILPPKSSVRGKKIREDWLLGRRGHKPSTWLPRRDSVLTFKRKR